MDGVPTLFCCMVYGVWGRLLGDSATADIEKIKQGQMSRSQIDA